MFSSPDNLDRYHRQTLLPGLGEAGQRRLLAAHALIVGCGALGSCLADSLARAGVGTLTLVDRDLVEITNLQRQILYDESDVREGMPKAEAAARRLREINSSIDIRPVVDDFDARNAERLSGGADIIIDGLDNFETRYLLNDLAVARGLPYIYGGAVGTQGMSVPILPHPRKRVGSGGAVTWSDADSTPCLRCIFPDPPPPGSSPTCDTAGVLGPLVSMVAAHQATQALKLLSGNLTALDRALVTFEVWDNEIRRLDLAGAADAEACPCCGQGQFDYLHGNVGSATTSLCGRNAVQVTPAQHASSHLDLEALGRQLAAHGTFTSNAFLLRGVLRDEAGRGGEPVELTVFATGRAIIKGVTEPEVARSLVAKYIGS